MSNVNNGPVMEQCNKCNKCNKLPKCKSFKSKPVNSNNLDGYHKFLKDLKKNPQLWYDSHIN